MGVCLQQIHSRKLNKKMMERKGKTNHHAVILGKGQGFLYFVLVNSFQGVILYFSFIASWIQCGCTIFGAPHLSTVLCVCLRHLAKHFKKIIFRVYLLNRKRKLNQDKTTCYRVISSLNSFSFFLLSRTSGRASDCKCPAVSTRVPHLHPVVTV